MMPPAEVAAYHLLTAHSLFGEETVETKKRRREWIDGEEQRLVSTLEGVLSDLSCLSHLVHFPDYYAARLKEAHPSPRHAGIDQIAKRSPRLIDLLHRDQTLQLRGVQWNKTFLPPAKPDQAHDLRDWLAALPAGTRLSSAAAQLRTRQLATDCGDAVQWAFLRTIETHLGSDTTDAIFTALGLRPLVRPTDSDPITPLSLFTRPWARHLTSRQV